MPRISLAAAWRINTRTQAKSARIVTTLARRARIPLRQHVSHAERIVHSIQMVFALARQVTLKSDKSARNTVIKLPRKKEKNTHLNGKLNE